MNRYNKHEVINEYGENQEAIESISKARGFPWKY